jgi:hypothetical protein
VTRPSQLPPLNPSPTICFLTALVGFSHVAEWAGTSESGRVRVKSQCCHSLVEGPWTSCRAPQASFAPCVKWKCQCWLPTGLNENHMRRPTQGTSTVPDTRGMLNQAVIMDFIQCTVACYPFTQPSGDSEAKFCSWG